MNMCVLRLFAFAEDINTVKSLIYSVVDHHNPVKMIQMELCNSTTEKVELFLALNQQQLIETRKYTDRIGVEIKQSQDKLCLIGPN